MIKIKLYIRFHSLIQKSKSNHIKYFITSKELNINIYKNNVNYITNLNLLIELIVLKSLLNLSRFIIHLIVNLIIFKHYIILMKS